MMMYSIAYEPSVIRKKRSPEVVGVTERLDELIGQNNSASLF